MTDMQSLVLVVEDSATQRRLIKSLLEKAGYRVNVAHDGREGLESVRAERPELIVTDLEMPEMNGLELVRAIKHEFSDLPVVLATAVGSLEIAAEALRMGAASYVPKSELADLVPTIQRILSLTGEEIASSRLSACMTYEEIRFELGHDGSLAAALIKQLVQVVKHFQLCDANTLMRVATALEEALQNAIVHGNLEVSSKLRETDDGREYFQLAKARRVVAPYCDRRVFVSARATQKQVEFTIRDEGPGFDVTQIPDPTSPAHLDKPCGRGLFLIHAFMDDVRHNEIGNEITMILRRQRDVV